MQKKVWKAALCAGVLTLSALLLASRVPTAQDASRSVQVYREFVRLMEARNQRLSDEDIKWSARRGGTSLFIDVPLGDRERELAAEAVRILRREHPGWRIDLH